MGPRDPINLRPAAALVWMILAACSSPPAVDVPPAAPATGGPASTDVERSVVLPPPYTGPLELVRAEGVTDFCEKPGPPFSLPAEGVLQLAFLPNRRCDDVNSDLDLFEVLDRLYLAQRNARGFRLVDVTDPTRPFEIGEWWFEPRARQEHITAFRQFDRRFLALPLESPTPYGDFPCGLAIVEVTEPQAPVLLGRYDGATLHSNAAWCNVHAVEVDADAEGNATYLFIATLNTADLRVLDIRSPDEIREVNVFHQHLHPHGEYGSWGHRAAILGDRVYISYWGGGVIVVDKHGLERGFPPDQIILSPPGTIDPDNFVAHDAQPTADGEYLFVNDMGRTSGGLRLFDIRDLNAPREIWMSQLVSEAGQHTIRIRDNLLFVPLFDDGLRVFRFDLSEPGRPVVDLLGFQSVRTPPFAISDGGVSALQTHDCQVDGVVETCIYASDEEMGLIVLAVDSGR